VIRRRVVRALIRAGHRLHQADDLAARSRGLRVRTAGYGLTRRYHDPRWTGRVLDPS
jgi:hypothetical protein